MFAFSPIMLMICEGFFSIGDKIVEWAIHKYYDLRNNYSNYHYSTHNNEEPWWEKDSWKNRNNHKDDGM